MNSRVEFDRLLAELRGSVSPGTSDRRHDALVGLIENIGMRVDALEGGVYHPAVEGPRVGEEGHLKPGPVGYGPDAPAKERRVIIEEVSRDEWAYRGRAERRRPLPVGTGG